MLEKINTIIQNLVRPLAIIFVRAIFNSTRICTSALLFCHCSCGVDEEDLILFKLSVCIGGKILTSVVSMKATVNIMDAWHYLLQMMAV